MSAHKSAKFLKEKDKKQLDKLCKFEEETSKMVKEVLGKRFELLEGFAKAYMAEIAIDGKVPRIEDIELVEERTAGRTVWYFSKRQEK